MQYILILHALILAVLSREKRTLPPKSGKHFYASFFAPRDDLHFVDIMAGSQKKDMDLWITSAEHQMGLFTVQCPKSKCDVPNRWRSEDSNSKKIISQKVQSEQAQIYDVSTEDHRIVPNTFKGIEIEDMVIFKFGRSRFNVTVNFLAINSATHRFKSKYDGYLGIAPSSTRHSGLNQDNNFMQQIKDKGYIEHNVISFYTTMYGGGNQSSIKFGSWDEEGILEGHDLVMLKSANLDTWAVRFYQLEVNSLIWKMPVRTRYMLIEPQLPYLYIPGPDFLDWMGNLAKLYPNVHCNFNKGSCMFLESCDTLHKKASYVKFIIGDTVKDTFDIIIRLESTFTSGDQFGDSKNQCYIPVFKSAETKQDTWHIGNLFMQNYYTVFDMTPHDERNENFIQVGLARQNPNNVIIWEHGIEDDPPPVIVEPEPESSGGAAAVVIILLLLIAAGGGGFYYWRKNRANVDDEAESLNEEEEEENDDAESLDEGEDQEKELIQ